MMNYHHNRKDFIHHQQKLSTSTIRESVFGVEDGMVSTFGAITGIAAATQDPSIVLLSGLIIISVESISMGVGSYISSKSEKAIDERKLHEEKLEVEGEPEHERKEMEGLFIKDGWPSKLAKTMADTASQDNKLLLREMAYRELKVFPDNLESPGKNAFAMWISYIVGGFIPLGAYFFLPISSALAWSIPVTLLGLFIVGAATTKFSKRNPLVAGTEMLALASIAGAIGYFVGQLVNTYL
jgi:VIT1/CCC1 family predicted Fe2+/Mn2+ transporter